MFKSISNILFLSVTDELKEESVIISKWYVYYNAFKLQLVLMILNYYYFLKPASVFAKYSRESKPNDQ